MKRWLVLIVIQATLIGLIFWPDPFTELRIFDIPSLGTGYRAKEMCSCLYVLERTEADCNAWTRDISLNAAFAIDAKRKAVTSTYLWLGASLPLFASTASFQDENRGCLLLR